MNLQHIGSFFFLLSEEKKVSMTSLYSGYTKMFQWSSNSPLQKRWMFLMLSRTVELILCPAALLGGSWADSSCPFFHWCWFRSLKQTEGSLFLFFLYSNLTFPDPLRIPSRTELPDPHQPHRLLCKLSNVSTSLFKLTARNEHNTPDVLD